jgi:hypothetical protein
MKIVINTCYGGFGLSDKAMEHWAKLKGIDLERRDSTWFKNGYDYYRDGKFLSRHDFERDDPALIQTIIELGDACTDSLADLKIVEIPDGVEWQIEEYDGIEWVAEKHRTWS